MTTDYARELASAQESGADYTWERTESGGHRLDVWPADGGAPELLRFDREGRRIAPTRRESSLTA